MLLIPTDSIQQYGGFHFHLSYLRFKITAYVSIVWFLTVHAFWISLGRRPLQHISYNCRSSWFCPQSENKSWQLQVYWVLCSFVNKGIALKECKFAQAAVNMTSQCAEFIPFRQSNTVIAVTNVSILRDYWTPTRSSCRLD